MIILAMALAELGVNCCCRYGRRCIDGCRFWGQNWLNTFSLGLPAWLVEALNGLLSDGLVFAMCSSPAFVHLGEEFDNGLFGSRLSAHARCLQIESFPGASIAFIDIYRAFLLLAFFGLALAELLRGSLAACCSAVKSVERNLVCAEDSEELEQTLVYKATDQGDQRLGRCIRCLYWFSGLVAMLMSLAAVIISILVLWTGAADGGWNFEERDPLELASLTLALASNFLFAFAQHRHDGDEDSVSKTPRSRAEAESSSAASESDAESEAA
eukprot:TRINITY_DN835_c0_g2_i1.p1 TRINITY_DN835_c0_g2~~TRINITY_DN835_c0_g2_i1.p1  ORF type:complete len:270 (-),score=83.33 TRINITY_DN835_c0_g2_i1:30-839(-)